MRSGSTRCSNKAKISLRVGILYNAVFFQQQYCLQLFQGLSERLSRCQHMPVVLVRLSLGRGF